MESAFQLHELRYIDLKLPRLSKSVASQHMTLPEIKLSRNTEKKELSSFTAMNSVAISKRLKRADGG